MNNSDLFERVESLQNLLISRATGGEAHEAQYKMLRSRTGDGSLFLFAILKPFIYRKRKGVSTFDISILSIKC